LLFIELDGTKRQIKYIIRKSKACGIKLGSATRGLK
jgi:hypothetical protein